MIQELQHVDVPNFRHKMYFRKCSLFDYQVEYPANGKSLLPIGFRVALMQKFGGITDRYVHMMYGNIIKLDWFEDTRSQAGGYWKIVNIKKPPLA